MENFHFLRPLWLLLLLLLPLYWTWLGLRASPLQRWRRIIAPHLIESLILRSPQRQKRVTGLLVSLILLLSAVVLAGPSWRREAPALFVDQSILMIALDLSSEMTPEDLKRAQRKITDLVRLRAGARTGLVLFAGSAHLALPPTSDGDLFPPFIEALSPDLMPHAGRRLDLALTLARQALTAGPQSGSILIIAHRLAPEDAMALQRLSDSKDGPPIVLTLSATPTPAGLPIRQVGLQDDAADVVAIQNAVESHYAAAAGDDPARRWRDDGYPLLPILAILLLLCARRGVVRALFPALILFMLAFGQSASAENMLLDHLLTPDQYGRLLLAEGDAIDAASVFSDPLWRGIAYAQASEPVAAAAAFANLTTARGLYNLGTISIRLGQYDKAVTALEQAAALDADNEAIRQNLTIARQLVALAANAKPPDEQRPEAQLMDEPDSARFDPTKRSGDSSVTKDAADVVTADAAAVWLRQVQTTEADFLRVRFALERPPEDATP